MEDSLKRHTKIDRQVHTFCLKVFNHLTQIKWRLRHYIILFARWTAYEVELSQISILDSFNLKRKKSHKCIMLKWGTNYSAWKKCNNGLTNAYVNNRQQNFSYRLLNANQYVQGKNKDYVIKYLLCLNVWQLWDSFTGHLLLSNTYMKS